MNITPVCISGLNSSKQIFNTKNTRMVTPAFAGNKRIMPEDEFIRQDNNKSVKNIISGKMAEDYISRAQNINKQTYLCKADDAGNLDNVIITLSNCGAGHRNQTSPGENLAFCLGDQPLAKLLFKDKSISISMSSNPSDNPDILLPSDANAHLRLSNSGGKILAKNLLPGAKNIGFAHKVYLDSNKQLDDEEIIFLPLENIKKRLGNINHVHKNKTVPLGNINDFYRSPKVIVLPSEKDYNNAFLVCRQKRFARLNNGESIVVGRKSSNDINYKRDDKLYTDLRDTKMISREQLVIVNVNGELYMTNIGQNPVCVADYVYDM